MVERRASRSLLPAIFPHLLGIRLWFTPVVKSRWTSTVANCPVVLASSGCSVARSRLALQSLGLKVLSITIIRWYSVNTSGPALLVNFDNYAYPSTVRSRGIAGAIENSLSKVE